MIVTKVFKFIFQTTYLTFCAGKPAKKEPPIEKKVAAEGKGSGKGGKSASANNSAAGGGKARTPSGNRKHQAPQPDRNELLKSLM